MFNNFQEKFGSKFLEIAKKSKDSSEIFEMKTIYESKLSDIDFRILILENQKANASEEEVERIKTQIEELKKQKESIELNPLQRFTHSLTQKGELLLQRPNIDDSNGRNLYFSSYLDLIKKATEDGYYMDKIDPDLINIGKTYVEKFLNGDDNSNLEKTIRSKFNEFFLNQPDPRFIFDDLFEEDN
jgi:endo-alpha-1,4-polygalactosaminidase (GH114 family)